MPAAEEHILISNIDANIQTRLIVVATNSLGVLAAYYIVTLNICKYIISFLELLSCMMYHDVLRSGLQCF